MNPDDKIHQIEVSRIKEAGFNPVSRTTPKSLKNLKNSISRVGILQPLLITLDFDLVDGHRRLACAKMLEMPTVPCIFTSGSQQDIYKEVNSTAKTLTRANDLFIYLSGGSMSGRSKADIEYLEGQIGRSGLEMMAEREISPMNVNHVASSYLTRLLSITRDDPFMPKAILWMLTLNQLWKVRVAVMTKLDPAIVRLCIENNVPLPV